MVVSIASVEQHSSAVGTVVDLAMRDLTTVWRTLTLDDAAQAQREISRLLPLIVDAYETPLAALSTDWYDELRDAAQVRGRYTAMPGYGPGTERLNALSGFTADALYGESPDARLAFSRVSGGLQRVLTGIDRDTIAGNAARDTARVTYARHARSDACAFCAMLATRDDYSSEAAALSVVGRGTDVSTNIGRTRGRRAGGIRARGSRNLGDSYHDDCRCTAVPIFEGSPLEVSPQAERFKQAYYEAGQTRDPTRMGGALDRSATLSNMRKILETN